jgi:hypothetical protein
LRKWNDTPVLPVILDTRLVAINSSSSSYDDGYRRDEESILALASQRTRRDSLDYVRIGLAA